MSESKTPRTAAALLSGNYLDALIILCKQLENDMNVMKQRNAVLRERPDLPVDRLPAIARYEATIADLQAKLQHYAASAFSANAKLSKVDKISNL